MDKVGVRVSIASRLGSASPSFENRDFITLLREQDIGLVVADTAGKWPLLEDTTSDLVYVRLHGDTELIRQRLYALCAAELGEKSSRLDRRPHSRWRSAGCAAAGTPIRRA